MGNDRKTTDGIWKPFREMTSSLKDPFNERSPRIFRKRLHVLGGMFEFESSSRRLLQLVDSAYSGLQRHRLSSAAPRFYLKLQLAPGAGFAASSEPPAMRMNSGAGLLCGAMDAANFAIVCPEARTGLVSCSRELLRFPYRARYELLEFAVFTLASRAQGLAPLHAGCIGSNGNGALLIGDSGAGKSTLALQCMLQGLDFIAEDAVFVAPKTMLATGVANFLHLREDSLRFIDHPSIAAHIRTSPVIRRHSGIEKFEIDLRNEGYRLARTPLKIIRIVFISKIPAVGSVVLTPIGRKQALEKLTASQPYAANLPSWAPFVKHLPHIDAFELRRGRHPTEAATVLRRLTGG